MGFWDILQQIAGVAGNRNGIGTQDTSVVLPGQSVPGRTTGSGGTGAAQGSSAGWEQYLPLILGTAATLGGTALQGRANNQYNDLIRSQMETANKNAAAEQARRDYWTGIMMPQILQGLGRKNPQQLMGAYPYQQKPAAPVSAPTGAGGPTTYGTVDPLAGYGSNPNMPGQGAGSAANQGGGNQWWLDPWNAT